MYIRENTSYVMKGKGSMGERWDKMGQDTGRSLKVTASYFLLIPPADDDDILRSTYPHISKFPRWSPAAKKTTNRKSTSQRSGTRSALATLEATPPTS